MKHMNSTRLGCVYLICLCCSLDAYACSIDAWNGGNSGSISVGSPSTISRVSELCGMEVTGQGHVQDNRVSDTRTIVRFYVYPKLTGTGTIDVFEAYGNEVGGSPLFKIAFNGTQFVFNPAGASGGSAFNISAVTGWNLIEIDWTSGGNFNAWVNTDTSPTAPTPDGTTTAGTGTVESIRLGAPNGLGGFTGGFVRFDSYEAHRTTVVGSLLIGDANADAAVNIFDYGSVQSDIAGTLQEGQPDCNLDGSVNIFDYGCVQLVIAGS